MLVVITDIYYSMFILVALLPLLMIKNSLFVVMVVRVEKLSISIKKANVEEISYRMKKLVSPFPKYYVRTHPTGNCTPIDCTRIRIMRATGNIEPTHSTVEKQKPCICLGLIGSD
jgi:hypothetical protein